MSNPTERLVRHFQTETVPGHDLVCSLFPVSYHEAAERMQALLEIGGRDGKPFDIVLMLGLAAGSKQWRVERQGRNFRQALADSANFTPETGTIFADAPERLLATLPLQAQVEALERLWLPVAVSDSAGGYLCNYLLYTTLRQIERAERPIRAGFLHVPADEQTFAPGLTAAPLFPFEQHVAAVRAVLQALAETPSSHSVGDRLDLQPASLPEG